MTNTLTIPQGDKSFVVEAWWDGSSMPVATMRPLPTNGVKSKTIEMWRNAIRYPERRGYSQSHWRKLCKERADKAGGGHGP